MAYIGRQPTAAPLTSADITDGTILNADIAAGAAIEQTKLATLSITDSNIADGALAQAKISNLTTDLGGKASLTADQTFTAANRGTITAVTPAASVTFDLTTTNNFSLTLVSGSADPTLNFSTLTSAMVGQSGNIYLDNVSGGTQKTISKASNILMTSAEFNALSQTAGKYWLSYFVVDTTNVVVTASAALS
jgi:hypothetical protein